MKLAGYQGIVNLLTVVARSGYSGITDLSIEQGLEAKTVTSLLIIPALLVKVLFVIVM
jgi:hypothetical protein